MSDKWTLLITGADHGLVGAFGNPFAAHPDWYERVDVVRADHHAELVEALREAEKALEQSCDSSPFIEDTWLIVSCALAKLDADQ